MALTLFAEIGFAAVQLMLGIDSPVSLLIVRDMVLKAIYAFFLGWPIYLAGAAHPAPRPRRGAAGAEAQATDGAGSLGVAGCTFAPTDAGPR